MHLSGGDNYQLLENIMDWVTFKSMVVSVRDFKICTELRQDCQTNMVFKPRDRVFVLFKAFDDAGQQITDPKDFYLRLKMYEVFLMQEFRASQLGSELYFVYDFDAFEHIGIYKTNIIYTRPGFFLDAPGTERELIFRIFRDSSN